MNSYEVVWTGIPSDLPERFRLNIAVTPSGCWEWRAAKTNGYGRYRLAGKMLMAHRYAYEQAIGPIPDGLQIDHLCRNRSCVNPNHLEAVTPRANTLRGFAVSAKNAMKTHCPRGHSLSGNNLLLNPKERICRTCKNERTRLWGRNNYVLKGNASHRVLRYLEQHPDVSADVVAINIGAPLTTVLSALDRLLRAGRVARSHQQRDTKANRARWRVQA